MVSNEAPHLSLIPLIVREIKDAALRNETGEGEIITTLKQAVLARVDVRLSISEVAQVVTLLDPSLKRLMIADIGLSEAKRLILQHAQKAVERWKAYKSTQSQPTTTRASEGETSSSIGLGQTVLIRRVIVATGCAGSGVSSVSNQIESSQAESLSKKNKLLKKFSHADTTYNLRVQLEREINTYLTLDLNITDENPLCFWKCQCESFPNLSTLAKNYLCISASSVGVEGMFSVAGLILNSKRSTKAPYRANFLSFIHDNYPKYYPITRLLSYHSSTKATTTRKQLL